jgi:DNA end-binding protein Ku
MVATKRNRGPTVKHRASWKGQFTFGLVSFPVEAFNAFDRGQSDIHFHQIHADCHRRIRYQKVCPVHGEIVNDEIVSGYEVKKGQYVEIDPDELDELRTQADRALKIDAFVTPETIDPLYFDGRMYYLVPAGASAEEPYAVLIEAMERENRHGVGQVVFSGKDQIVLVRPYEGILHMAMLNYEAEIRPPKKLAAALGKPKSISREVRLAQSIVEEWSEDEFDFSKYEDTYRERVKELIEAKMRGQKITPPEEEEPTEVLSLMDALKKSIRYRGGKSRKKRRRSA